MYLVYLGESGNTGTSTKDLNQPHHVYAGLLVHESQSIAINGEFDALIRRHFGQPRGEPGTPDILKTADVYQGRGHFNSWPPVKRNELIQDCLSILIRRESPVITAFINKQEFDQARSADDNPSLVWDTPAEPTISRFLLALSMFMDELNMSNVDPQQLLEQAWPVTDFAMVVAGDDGSVKPRFMADFLRSEDGIDASALLESFCFAGPEHSACAQLANMCAYFTRRWLQDPSAPHPYFYTLRDNKVIQVIYPVHV
jgi:hypothetical protein